MRPSWKNQNSNIGFSTYPYGGYWIYPALRTNLYQKLVKTLRRNNFSAVKFVFFPEWYNQGLDIWLISKMLWDSDINIDSLKNQYYSALYPKSKNIIQEFHTYLERRFANINVCVTDFTITSKKNRKLFTSIFQRDTLLIYKNAFTELIDQEKLSSKEKINIENLNKIIDLLVFEFDAYIQFEIARTMPNLKKKIKFKAYVESLRKTVCITNKSAYFNPKKSPSFYLNNKNDESKFY